jgi:uncharacterized protein YbjT (DUF2867 family)
MKARRVLVTGATGQQGGAVARHLLQSGIAVRAMTRSPGSPSARTLAELGAEIVYGDMDDAATLTKAVAGADSVFSVQDFYAPNTGYEGEVRQGKNLVSAAAAAGVAHFVQSTMAEAPGSQAVAHFQSKFAVERAVIASGLAYTFIGTVWFMDNLLNAKMGGLMSFPFLAGALSRDTPTEMLAVDDVGAVVARVFENTESFAGKKLDIAGDRMTVPQMKEIFRAQTGKRPPPLFIPRWLARRLSRDFAAQLAWQEAVGWDFSLDVAKSVWPAMRTFSQYLQEHRANFK